MHKWSFSVSIKRKVAAQKKRRKLRVASRIKQGKSEQIRVSVFRSLKNIYAQLIDDSSGKTIVSSSSIVLQNTKGDKKAIARVVGLELAKQAKEKNISTAIFDRGRFLYHGRVQALAEGLREGGLQI